jgi:hypothetical protein
MNLAIELKTRIYEHIGQVRKHLGDFAADEQREIVESIETHIYDALESRVTGEPGMELLDVIIAEMDPPESYGSDNFSHEYISGRLSPIQQNKSPIRRMGKNCAILALALIALSVGLNILKPTTTGEVVSSDQTEFVKPAPGPEPADTEEQAVAQSPIIGKWTAIDFVSSISEFNPASTVWKKKLSLKSLHFFADGKTNKPWLTWKNNRLFHGGDHSVSELLIVTVNQTDYLFMEWMSGDVLVREEPPSYYVFKREAYIEPH